MKKDQLSSVSDLKSSSQRMRGKHSYNDNVINVATRTILTLQVSAFFAMKTQDLTKLGKPSLTLQNHRSHKKNFFFLGSLVEIIDSFSRQKQAQIFVMVAVIHDYHNSCQSLVDFRKLIKCIDRQVTLRSKFLQYGGKFKPIFKETKFFTTTTTSSNNFFTFYYHFFTFYMSLA